MIMTRVREKKLIIKLIMCVNTHMAHKMMHSYCGKTQLHARVILLAGIFWVYKGIQCTIVCSSKLKVKTINIQNNCT